MKLFGAAVMIAGDATIRVWPIIDTRGMDRTTVRFWPEPSLVLDADPEDGPVVVENSYMVATEKEEPFLKAMASIPILRCSRPRRELFWMGRRATPDGRQEEYRGQV